MEKKKGTVQKRTKMDSGIEQIHFKKFCNVGLD